MKRGFVSAFCSQLLHITRARPLADRLSLLAFSTLHVMVGELLMCGGSALLNIISQ